MSMNKAFAMLGSVAVAIAVISGLYLGGSPADQRILRFDERRAQDLRAISRAIERRWDKTERLPEALDELVDGQTLRSVPLDPVTESSYVYEPGSDNTYRLCADFVKPSVLTDPTDFWTHDAGYQCFEFTLVNKDSQE